MERVLLTGVTGYIGQHCAAELLRRGYEVVGTIRSRAKAEATRAAIAKVAPTDALRFTEADLLAGTGWDAAMTGCTFVMHVASPFVLAEPKDEAAIITPAVDGTRRVVQAARRAGVRRLVLTSSTFAMIAGKESGRYGPEAWSDASGKIGAYAKSKTLAERAAWEAAEGGAMELTVICPGAVFGPSLDAKMEGQSLAMMAAMIGGKMPMVPDLSLGMVDVRDVARLHANALTAAGAAGKRFIAATAEPIAMASMAHVLRQAGYSKVPTRRAPTAMLKMMALFDREVRGMLPFIGKAAAFDTAATCEVLAWTPTAIETSFREMAAAIAG